MPPTYRVLVIDDTASIHDDFRKILCPPLQRNADMDAIAAAVLGDESFRPARPTFIVDSAMQGQEGLSRVLAARNEGRPYSVAFVDMRMPPGWNGTETIRRIWEVDRDLQVVVCTAYSDAAWDDMLHQLGEPESLLVLKKPFDNVEALQMARTLAHKSSLERRWTHAPAPTAQTG